MANKSVNRIGSRFFLAAILSFVLFSFSLPKGGEGFEVYLGNRLVLQQFGNQLNQTRVVHIEPSDVNAELSVKYWHCGKIGKDRTITLKDGQDRIIKQWHFANNAETVSPMNCSVQEILQLKAGHGNTLKLYYASSELPAGRLLASIEVSQAKKA